MQVYVLRRWSEFNLISRYCPLFRFRMKCAFILLCRRPLLCLNFVCNRAICLTGRERRSFVIYVLPLFSHQLNRRPYNRIRVEIFQIDLRSISLFSLYFVPENRRG